MSIYLIKKNLTRTFFSLLAACISLLIFDSPLNANEINSDANGDEVVPLSENSEKHNDRELAEVVVSSEFDIAKYDYIISQFDGNNNDKDDIAALPIAAALTNARGFQQKSIFFYNNNLSEPNDQNQLDRMRKSAAFAEQLGIETVDYQTDLSAATDKLVDIFNSGKKVLSLEGGPMEAVYRGLEQTSEENFKNITLMSHSNWNEDRDRGNRPGGGKPRTWQDIKNDFPEVTLIEIANQNGVWLGSFHDENTGFQNPRWEWLDSTTNSVLREARALMANAESKVNDPSDAGMHFFAFTGNETGDPDDAQQFFATNSPKVILTSRLIDEPIVNPITPFNLVNGSYQGRFANQGIPSFFVFLSAIRSNKIEAKDLIQSAIESGRLSANTFNDAEYIHSVDVFLDGLDKN